MTEKEKKYQPSSAVKQAQQAIRDQEANKPSQYQSQWQSQLEDAWKQIQNRPSFNYDVNADALWNQYKDQYVNQGQQAMMDTMGQAQAMTGGYGNSYAQTVGQQTYQGYLQGLNDRLPEFYQMAQNRYQAEGNDLLNRYGMMADRESQDYGRWQDIYNRYYTELNRLQGIYDNERNFEYSQYRDKVADQQWQTEWDEYIRRYNYENGLGEFASSGGGDYDDNETSYRSPAPLQEAPLETLTKAEQAKIIHQSVASGEITQNQAQALLKQLK